MKTCKEGCSAFISRRIWALRRGCLKRRKENQKRLTQPSQPASDSGAGPRMVLLPADAERNLEDRSIFELVSRYWRPIREIRQPGDDGGETREGDIPVELESPIADLRAILCEDPAVFRRSLERMYAEIRGRAAAIRLDIDSPPEQDSHGARYRS